MKYQKHLAILAIATLVSSQTTFASSMTSGESGMFNEYNTQEVNANEAADNALNEDLMNENDLVNADLFEVDTPTVHQGDLILSNVDEINISDVLYVYGDMTVTNVDTFTVTGKLRVTGKLTVINGSIDAKGGKVYFGKKRIVNGSISGKQKKVPTVLAKLDPILRTDISDEEYTALLKTANDASKEYAALIKELMSARKIKGDTASIVEKIIQSRADFYNEVEQYIQEEDMELFSKIEKTDTTSVNKKIKITLGTANR